MSEIWDCFFFNDELDLLEARLHELGDVVDRFVIVEGDRTFRGEPKPLVFDQNRERFLPWNDKIAHVVARLEVDKPSAWDRENRQRAILGSYLKDAADPSDLILLGDVDEFPDRDAFPYLRRHEGPPLRLVMHHSVYFANWILPRPWWNGTLAFRPAQFEEPLVRLQLGDNHRDWDGYQEVQLDDGGVHMSFLGGAEAIRRKVAAYSHQEFNTERFIGAPHLERCLSHGVHFQGREALRRLRRRELSPLLLRMSERPSSESFFNFAAPALTRAQVRAYCGYTWLRTNSSVVPDRFRHFVDRHPGLATGPGAPFFWALDAVLRLRRRMRPAEWALTAEFAPDHVAPPIVERWR